MCTYRSKLSTLALSPANNACSVRAAANTRTLGTTNCGTIERGAHNATRSHSTSARHNAAPTCLLDDASAALLSLFGLTSRFGADLAFFDLASSTLLSSIVDCCCEAVSLSAGSDDSSSCAAATCAAQKRSSSETARSTHDASTRVGLPRHTSTHMAVSSHAPSSLDWSSGLLRNTSCI